MTDKEKIKSFCFIKHEAEFVNDVILHMEDLDPTFWHFRLFTLQEKIKNISEEVEKMLDDEVEE